MRYIGIDPGVTGGVAILQEDGKVAGLYAMPPTVADLRILLESVAADRVRAVLERVWSSPGWGHAGAFTFGRVYGRIEGVLDGVRIPFDEVIPRKWQQAMNCTPPAGLTPIARKNLTKAAAQRLFPKLSITHATADALLIAEYCRRLHAGTSARRPSAKRTR